MAETPYVYMGASQRRLTIRFTAAGRMRQRRTKALYPDHRHCSDLTEAACALRAVQAMVRHHIYCTGTISSFRALAKLNEMAGVAKTLPSTTNCGSSKTYGDVWQAAMLIENEYMPYE
jgi:hypothetical protein